MKVTVTTRTKMKIFIDILIFAGFLVAWDPRSTGIAIHEWLTIGGIAALVIHLLLSWSWIVEIGARFFGVLPPRTRFNYILNSLLFIDMTLIMFTGIMISQKFMPFLGIVVERNPMWRGVHDATSNLFVLLLGVHLALHWGWIVRVSKRYLMEPVAALLGITGAAVQQREAKP